MGGIYFAFNSVTISDPSEEVTVQSVIELNIDAITYLCWEQVEMKFSWGVEEERRWKMED